MVKEDSRDVVSRRRSLSVHASPIPFRSADRFQYYMYIPCTYHVSVTESDWRCGTEWAGSRDYAGRDFWFWAQFLRKSVKYRDTHPNINPFRPETALIGNSTSSAASKKDENLSLGPI